MSYQRNRRYVSSGCRGYTGRQVLADVLNEARGSGELWEDPEFPADAKSLFYSRDPPRPFVWQRPHEIVREPKLIVDDASRFDVNQGYLGDCWLLAAVASLSLHPQLFARVVPGDLGFDEDSGYCGVFHFQFWRFGKWVDVIIDDRLPTWNGKLVFMHSEQKDEFWTPLIEKAYAKLFGSYEALKGGSTSEAMEDFTGGATETFDFTKDIPENLFDIMYRANNRSSLMACSISAKPNVVEAKLDNGLVMGHAYSVTDVKKVEIDASEVKLIRVRNPWGNEREWNGAWSDRSDEWRNLSQSDIEDLDLRFDKDGEFWMSYEDFSTCYQQLEICHLGPDSAAALDLEGEPKRQWQSSVADGKWQTHMTAGGCRNFIATFASNPQYRVKVEDPDEDDADNTGTLIVGLMQKDRRKMRAEGKDMVPIGYAIYLMKDGFKSQRLDTEFFSYNASVATSSFINRRENCGRHKLSPGDYVIVPSTFDPDVDVDFLIRIFSERPCPSGELDEETSSTDVEPEEESSGDEEKKTHIYESFKAISGRDLEVNYQELHQILKSVFHKTSGENFGIETCRSIVSLLDVDLSGRLGFEEFSLFFKDLRHWMGCFKKYDKDGSGSLDSRELRECFRKMGFSLSNSVLKKIGLRYVQGKGRIEFDDFILCTVRLKTILETYNTMPKDGERVSLTLDELINTAVSA